MPTNKAPQVAINDIGSPEEFLAAIDATINTLIPPLADLLGRATANGDIDCPNPNIAAAAILVLSAQLLDRDLLGWVKTRDIATIRNFGGVAERVIGAPTGTFAPIVDSFIASMP